MRTFAPYFLTAALILPGSMAVAGSQAEDRQILLSVEIEPRIVDLVEIGDFHFLPGQVGPTHTHDAPVFGYVSQGTIHYQVEGQAPQILKTGDAFFEPSGPRILHFDNASDSEVAVFTDFNLQQEGEPFIRFEEPLTEQIDRRSFPTAELDGVTVSKIEAYSETYAAGERITKTATMPIFGYVASGTVTISVNGRDPQIIPQGKSFFRPASAEVTLEMPGDTEIISFHLL